MQRLAFMSFPRGRYLHVYCAPVIYHTKARRMVNPVSPALAHKKHKQVESGGWQVFGYSRSTEQHAPIIYRLVEFNDSLPKIQSVIATNRKKKVHDVNTYRQTPSCVRKLSQDIVGFKLFSFTTFHGTLDWHFEQQKEKRRHDI